MQPAGAGSRLVMNLEASAQSIAYSQGYTRCSSRGSLEARLIQAIKAQLAAGIQ